MSNEKLLIEYIPLWIRKWFPGIIIVTILWWIFNVSQDIAHLKRMDDYTDNHFDTIDKKIEQIKIELERRE